MSAESPEPAIPAGRRGWQRRLRSDAAPALAVAGMVLVSLLGTEPDFGIVWDEGYTVRREQVLRAWFVRLCDPSGPGRGRHALARGELDHSWRFSRAEPDGHPPGYALLGLAGWEASHRWLRPLAAYRFGPMVLTAVTAGVLYVHLARRRGVAAGLAAAFLFVFMPRMFAHAHYAHYDMPMTCWWLLAQVAFVAALRDRRWSLAYGIALGLAAGTKFTGLFAVVPGAVWVAWTGVSARLRRGPTEGVEAAARGVRSLAVGIVVAACTLYAIQPPWWIDPVYGPLRFLSSNLSRARTQPLATLYWGRVYEFALPWHNTLVLTALTTPPLVLALAGLGAAACVTGRRERPCLLIWPLSWATLMVVRALPNAPGHDGIRLILPSAASLAVLAGLGVGALARRFGAGRGRIVAALVLAAAAGQSLWGIARMYPYTDSYFSGVIGGLRGAESAGFELTYYWESAGPELLDWARERAQASRRPIGLCFTMDATNHALLREWGELPPRIDTLDLNTPPAGRPRRPDYYVQQRRRGLYYPADRWLERHGRPVFAIAREGVDLLRVFNFQEYLDANTATRNEPIPRYLFR